jgi:hypothetical protein
MASNRRSRILAIVVAIACAGCASIGHVDGTSDAEYRAIFTQVIGKTLADAKKDNLCLPANQLGFLQGAGGRRIEINTDITDLRTPQAPLGRLGQFDALTMAGLMTREDTVREVNGRTQHLATFRPTAKGVDFQDNNTLCYARASLDRVVKWKGPIALGDYRAAFVYYTTKTGPLADWARMPEIAAAFPGIAANTSPETPKVRQVAIDKSSEGWDVAEYSRMLQLD